MNRSNASNSTSIRHLQPSRLKNHQALQMGATNTLADYLVSIRTKKHKQHTGTSTSRRQGRSNNKYDLKPSDRNKRSLIAQELWHNIPLQKRHPSMMNQKRNRSCLALGTITNTNTKRIKTSKQATRISLSRSSKQRIGGKSEAEGRLFQTSKHKLSGNNKLQPYFTKDSALRLHHDHCNQYQFEFPTDLLLDEDAAIVHPTNTTMYASPSCSNSSDCCSIISQITQDSSLNDEDEDDASNSSEEQGDTGDYDDDYDDGSAHHHIALFGIPPQDSKNIEVKEGARLLLDLLAM